MSSLEVCLQIDLPECDSLSGTVTDGDWIAALAANRAVFNARTHPAPQTGKYTLVIPGSDASVLVPGGDGFGKITVKSSGKVTFAGKLADGTAVSQSAIISQSGEWPFYAPLYSKKGSVLGWLVLDAQSPAAIHGSVAWFKPEQPRQKAYPDGFIVMSGPIGSRYNFVKGTPVLNLTGGHIVLESGNLPESIVNEFSMDAKSRITGPNKLRLTITTSSGLFKGSVMNPATGKMIPVSGVLLQNENIGAGYFLNGSQSGRVYVGP